MPFYNSDLGSFENIVSEVMLTFGSYIHLHYVCDGLTLARCQVPTKADLSFPFYFQVRENIMTGS